MSDNSHRKRLVVVSEHFYPSDGATSQLVTDLADDLNTEGVSLCVLTSTCGPSDKPYSIHRFHTTSSPDSRIFSKIAAGVRFFLRSLVWLFFNLHRNDSLLIVSNPPFIGLLGPVMSLLRRSCYIFLFQDIFPRSAQLTGIMPSKGPLSWFWKRLTSVVIRRSVSTVVLSESMSRRCHAEYGRDLNIVSIPNWAVFLSQSIPKRKSTLANKLGLLDTFTIQYSGNYGRLHDIITILEAARSLKDEPVKFVFIGAGAKSSQIHAYRQAYRLKNVIVMPYQPRALLADSISACDISIVSLIPGAEDTVAPSKFYGVIACGRPVLLISNPNSELGEIVTTSGCGVFLQQGDVSGFTSAVHYLMQNPSVLSQMGRNSLLLYSSLYGRLSSTSQYASLFRQHGMI